MASEVVNAYDGAMMHSGFLRESDAVDNGMRVDASLCTSHPDMYAAGDVASFHNPTLDQWLRVEHEDNANTMGRLAARARAGTDVAYDHLPSFYSDLFELGYEAVGELDSRLEIVADWKEPYHEGVFYSLRDGRVRGVLLWNVWEQVDAPRRLIAEGRPIPPGRPQGAAADLRSFPGTGCRTGQLVLVSPYATQVRDRRSWPCRRLYRGRRELGAALYGRGYAYLVDGQACAGVATVDRIGALDPVERRDRPLACGAQGRPGDHPSTLLNRA